MSTEQTALATRKPTVVYKKKSQTKDIWTRFKKNRLAIVGLLLLVIILLCTILADVIAPYSAAVESDMGNRLAKPSGEHLFGTDNYGRDILARVMHGSRNSFLMGFLAVLAAMVCGGVLGCVSGYFGGVVDSVILRFVDTLACIPSTLLALTIVAALGTGLTNVLIALMIAYIPNYTRVIRSSILSIVEQDFIEASKACGTPSGLIIWKHIMPNALGMIIVRATMSVGGIIIAAAGMSFLGMGIQPPEPEWGQMLSDAREYMRYSPHLAIFPGLAICLCSLSVNLIGDGLRDALDPRLKD